MPHAGTTLVQEVLRLGDLAGRRRHEHEGATGADHRGEVIKEEEEKQ